MSRKANSYYSVTIQNCAKINLTNSQWRIIFKNRFLFRKSCCKRKSIRLETFLLYCLPKVFALCSDFWSSEKKRRLNLHFLFNFPSAQSCKCISISDHFPSSVRVPRIYGGLLRCLKITEKSLIQHCERSELRLHFEWTKVN